MKIEKEWRACSTKSERVGKGDELINLAGRWGVGIDATITKPYTYSQGPVEKIAMKEEVHNEEPAFA